MSGATLVHPNALPDEERDDWDDALPSQSGFHCDGECFWEEGREGRWELKEFAVRQGSPWDSTEPAIHPIPDRLHPIQDTLWVQVLDHYRNGGLPDNPLKGNGYPRLLLIYGEWYVFQGTHRLTVAMERGQRQFYGHRFVVTEDRQIIPFEETPCR